MIHVFLGPVVEPRVVAAFVGELDPEAHVIGRNPTYTVAHTRANPNNGTVNLIVPAIVVTYMASTSFCFLETLSACRNKDNI